MVPAAVRPFLSCSCSPQSWFCQLCQVPAQTSPWALFSWNKTSAISVISLANFWHCKALSRHQSQTVYTTCCDSFVFFTLSMRAKADLAGSAGPAGATGKTYNVTDSFEVLSTLLMVFLSGKPSLVRKVLGHASSHCSASAHPLLFWGSWTAASDCISHLVRSPHFLPARATMNPKCQSICQLMLLLNLLPLPIWPGEEDLRW